MIENKKELIQGCKIIKNIINEQLPKISPEDIDQIEYLNTIKGAIELFVEYGIEHKNDALIEEGLRMVDNLIVVLPEKYGLREHRKIFGCDYI